VKFLDRLRGFSNRGTGWVDGLYPTVERIALSDRLVAASSSTRVRPDEGGCTRPLWVTDQGSEESCTDHAGTGCAYELTGFKGVPGVAWWFGRAFDLGFGETPPKYTVLPNVGVSMHGFCRALEKHGITTEGTWGPGKPNYPHRIPPGLARLSAQRLNLELQPIYAVGRAAVDALLDHLLTERPAILVVRADSAYRHPNANGVVGPASGSGGLHAVRVRRYRRVSDGSYQFLSPGSWGPFFGIQGEVWLDESRVSHAPAAINLAMKVS